MNSRTLLLVGGGVMALLLVFVIIVVASNMGDDGNGGNAASITDQPSTPAQGIVEETPDPYSSSPDPDSSPTEDATASPSVSPTGGETPKPPGTFLAEYKGIDITEGYYIDFTDNPKRPKEGSDGDLNYDSYQIDGNGKLGLIGEGEPASYETCHANTKYLDVTYTPEKGESWCVYTDGGLLGIIHIRALEGRYMTIDLKVWQGPAD